MLNLIFHTDLGHGWLEVPKSLVEALHVEVSQFSYEKDDKLFLEEDCDAPRFDEALKEANIKRTITGQHFEGDHPLRNYKRYTK